MILLCAVLLFGSGYWLCDGQLNFWQSLGVACLSAGSALWGGWAYKVCFKGKKRRKRK